MLDSATYPAFTSLLTGPISLGGAPRHRTPAGCRVEVYSVELMRVLTALDVVCLLVYVCHIYMFIKCSNCVGYFLSD